MRKLVIAAGLLLAAALLPGVPAQAAAGCQCVRFGTPSACLPTVTACNKGMHGICIAPCSYSPRKAMRQHAVRRHAVKRRMVRAGSVHGHKKHGVAGKPVSKKKPKKM